MNVLLIIDPQNDFMDSPSYKGSLAVKGAFDDMQRLSKWIEMHDIDNIVITMDTHVKYDISHPDWWLDKNNLPPNPFTIIKKKDVTNGVWRAKDQKEQDYSLFYVTQLSEQGKYPLCIWPYHCISGTLGWNIESTLKDTLNKWEKQKSKTIIYIYKGTNPKTEHYSGLKAEVVDINDESTYLNTNAINLLSGYKNIYIAGEALSHCVASTVNDLIENMQPNKLSNINLITDCMSSVEGFEKNGEEFLNFVKSKGINLITSNVYPKKTFKK